MAASTRCSTNQFSTQPATRLLLKSSTPVKAANKTEGAEQGQVMQHVLSLFGPDQGGAQK